MLIYVLSMRSIDESKHFFTLCLFIRLFIVFEGPFNDISVCACVAQSILQRLALKCLTVVETRSPFLHQFFL